MFLGSCEFFESHSRSKVLTPKCGKPRGFLGNPGQFHSAKHSAAWFALVVLGWVFHLCFTQAVHTTNLHSKPSETSGNQPTCGLVSKQGNPKLGAFPAIFLSMPTKDTLKGTSAANSKVSTSSFRSTTRPATLRESKVPQKNPRGIAIPRGGKETTGQSPFDVSYWVRIRVGGRLGPQIPPLKLQLVG